MSRINCTRVFTVLSSKYCRQVLQYLATSILIYNLMEWKVCTLEKLNFREGGCNMQKFLSWNLIIICKLILGIL